MRRRVFQVLALIVIAGAGALTFMPLSDNAPARPEISPVATTTLHPVTAVQPGNDHASSPAGVSTAETAARAPAFPAPGLEPAAGDTLPARPTRSTPPATPAATLPLSVVAADQTEHLTPLQTTTLSQLAEDFLTAVDRPQTDAPTDVKTPRGRREKDAWERERELNDTRYLAQFGQEAFNVMLIQRAAAESGSGASSIQGR